MYATGCYIYWNNVMLQIYSYIITPQLYQCNSMQHVRSAILSLDCAPTPTSLCSDILWCTIYTSILVLRSASISPRYMLLLYCSTSLIHQSITLHFISITPIKKISINLVGYNTLPLDYIYFFYCSFSLLYPTDILIRYNINLLRYTLSLSLRYDSPLSIR